MSPANSPSVLEEHVEHETFTSEVFEKLGEKTPFFPVVPILSRSTPGSSTPREPLRLLWIPSYILEWTLICCYRVLGVLWKVKLSLPWSSKGKKLGEYMVIVFLWLHEYYLNIDMEKPVVDFLTMTFWSFYFQLGEPKNFVQDYTTAFCRKYPEWSIDLFIDNGRHQSVPCDDGWNDKRLLAQLISFYNVARLTGMPFEGMDLRAIRRIDVARLQEGFVVGKRESVLNLSVSGPEGRPVHWFTHIDQMSEEQHAIINCLRNDKVLCRKDWRDRNCLNVIRTYRSSYVTLGVCIPTILSLIIGIVWTWVAATVFNEGVQTSAQTAFTVSSYIVTAGSFLIALIVYLEGRFEDSLQDSLAVEDIDPHEPVALRADNADHPAQAVDGIHPPDPAAPQVDNPAHSAQASVSADDANTANDTALPVATQETADPRRESESDSPERALDGASSTISLPKTAVSLPPGFV